MEYEHLSTEVKNYRTALKLYKNALKNLEQIRSKYSSSNLAISLMRGEAKISGLTFKEFRKTEGHLQSLVDAEESPLACALLIANKIENDTDKSKALAEIAAKYAEAGQKDKSSQIIDQARYTTKTIKDTFRDIALFGSIADKLTEITDKYIERESILSSETGQTVEEKFGRSLILNEIAGKYFEEGQDKKAFQILAKALSIANNIEVPFWKAFILYNISRKHAKFKQFNTALDIAENIEDVFWRVVALSKIADNSNEHNIESTQILSQALASAKTIKEAFWKALAPSQREYYTSQRNPYRSIG